MNLKEYFAKQGSRYSNEDAKIIGPALERLGQATAEDIVKTASEETSPLHTYFEWDNSVAADEYRKGQARIMAASIMIKVVDRGGKDTDVRAFHAVKFDKSDIAEEHRRYVPIDVVRKNEGMSDQVIEEAKKQLHGWRTRYNAYRQLFPEFEQQLGPVFDIITKVEEGQLEIVAS